MVTDPLFPDCPVRNVLARLCGPNTLWVIHLLNERQTMTQDELEQEMKGTKRSEVSAAITVLKADNIIASCRNAYRLSALGASIVPYIKGLVGWCEQQISPDSFQK